MKKNLIFLTLLISVLMVSVISAGITGYLVARGGGIATDGYTATLQKVEGTTAIVSVATPDGETEIVRVEEGKTAQVGDAQISASSLTRGTLFSRGGANVKIDVPAGEEGSAGTEEECSNYANGQSFLINGNKVILVLNKDGTFFFTDSNGKVISEKFSSETGSFGLYGETFTIGTYGGPGLGNVLTLCTGESETEKHWHIINPQKIIKYDPNVAGTQTILGEKVFDSNNAFVGTLFQKKLECPGKNRVLIEGGFVINHAGGSAYPYPDSYVVLASAPAEVNAYLVSIFQNANAKTKIDSVTLEMICAQLEPAVNKKTAHFPFLES